MNEKSKAFLQGTRDGLPIGLGYFAVAFSLGIAARNAGLSPFQGFIASFLTNASAGEYVVFSLLQTGTTILEIILITLITDARYILMSCALSQRLHPSTGLKHRLLIGTDITDELFAVAISHPGYIKPLYYYGAMTTSIPFWASGTALGIVMGNLLPARVVSALGVALFGMFLAVIVPPSKKSKVVAGMVIICFILSALCAYLPGISSLSEGTRTILLTLLVAGGAAILFPVKEEPENA